MNHAYLKLGELLLSHGAVTEAQLEASLELQANSGRRLGEILVEHGFVDEPTIAACLADQYGCDVLDPDTLTPEPFALEVIGPLEALAKRVLPVRLAEHELFCIIADPLNFPVTDDLGQKVNRPVRFGVAPESRLLAAIRTHYGLSSPEDSAEFQTCMPKRFREAAFRGRCGEIAWADVTDASLGRRVTLFRAPVSGPDGDEHWDLVRDAAIRCDARFVPVYDSEIHKGFRWTSFELLRGECLATILQGKGARTPSEAAELVGEVAKAAHEAASGFQRRSWVCPENVWIDGKSVLVAPALPVPSQYAEIATDVERLGSLLLHCLAGSFNARGLDSFGAGRAVPTGMLQIMEKCFTSREEDRLATARELAVALMSFQWTVKSSVETPASLERDELLANLHVVGPGRRLTIWQRLFGWRAA